MWDTQRSRAPHQSRYRLKIYRIMMIEKLIFVFLSGLLIINYFIKILLKEKGYKIHLVFNHSKDFQNFKQLISTEENIKRKKFYEGIRMAMVGFAAGLILVALIGVLSS